LIRTIHVAPNSVHSALQRSLHPHGKFRLKGFLRVNIHPTLCLIHVSFHENFLHYSKFLFDPMSKACTDFSAHRCFIIGKHIMIITPWNYWSYWLGEFIKLAKKCTFFDECDRCFQIVGNIPSGSLLSYCLYISYYWFYKSDELGTSYMVSVDISCYIKFTDIDIVYRSAPVSPSNSYFIATINIFTSVRH
jgi:hypothetical protein